MKLSDHFDDDIFTPWMKEAIPIYKEQIPATVFMALIGFVASIAWITAPDSEIGKSASKLITSLLSGLGLLNVLLMTTISILLFASVIRLIETDCSQSPARLIANCAARGFSSFFIPISALILVLILFMGFALNYASQEQLKSLDININAIFSMSTACGLLLFLPSAMLFICSIPLRSKSRPAQYLSFSCILGLWFIAFFDVIK
jgi:hypothetical protein